MRTSGMPTLPNRSAPASPRALRPSGADGRAKQTARRLIDKSVLAFPEPRRVRDREHLKFVARQPCLLCGRHPSDPHHLRFTQPRALGAR